MNIRTVTGSDEPLDNWTSLYTFALGMVAGSFVAVGVGEVDMIEGLRGDLLRIYLALVTAMLGGGIGMFAARVSDRISDRRAVLRRTRAAELRINLLIGELELYRMNFGEVQPNGADGLPDTDQTFGIQAIVERIANAASIPPAFDELVETLEDGRRANSALSWFQFCGSHFKMAWPDNADVEYRRAVLSGFLKEDRFSIAKRAIDDLNSVTAHFESKALAL